MLIVLIYIFDYFNLNNLLNFVVIVVINLIIDDDVFFMVIIYTIHLMYHRNHNMILYVLMSSFICLYVYIILYSIFFYLI